MVEVGRFGDVSLEPGELTCSLDEIPVHAVAGGVDAHEPVLLQRPFPGGDLLGAVDHGVDRPVVVLMPSEQVVVDHPPGPRGLTGAHDPGWIRGTARR
jgi:hypothetical protein